MPGLHGLANASGVRTTVPSDAPRRSLFLLGLLTGVLAAGWLLGASDAEAEEIAPVGATVAVDAPLTDTVDLVEGAPDTESDAGVETMADTTAEVAEAIEPAQAVEPVVPEESLEPVERLDRVDPAYARPLTDTVTKAGRETTDTVREVSATVASEVEVPDADLVTPVHRAVDEITGTVDARPDGVEGATEGRVDHAPGSDATSRTSGEASQARDTASVTPEGGPGATAAAPAEPRETTVSESSAVTGDAPFLDGSLAVLTGASSASGTSAPGLAAHLPAAGTPLPAPAFDGAVRHVLRAVPTAVADEPTFAPD
ncbi:hypothetical protein [Nocardiopsis sp. MG754419]|uniref:hypothetical protein n=1 Tax=Nocardiopsis sp. MG754419 TaxID=2259865 RepID=UPI001BA4EF7A|nr:hypothetical protein [Nocardiopsis sp. MG754419]MBR8741089.1 hypothetical protein [Nocardiopsis sp. MG754419]